MSDAFNSQTGFNSQLELQDAPPELVKPPQNTPKKVYVLGGVGLVILVTAVLTLLFVRPTPPPPVAVADPTPTIQLRSSGIKLELLEAAQLLEAADPNAALQPPPALDMKLAF